MRDLLEVCSHAKVMRGLSTTGVAASLRTCAAIMGHDSTAPLLPLLLQLSEQQHPPESGAAPTPRKPHACLLQPHEKLAARAVQLQALYGLSREQLAQLTRAFPRLVFAASHATLKLKALLLQLQLLGDGSHVAQDQLAPEIERIFRVCPQVGEGHMPHTWMGSEVNGVSYNTRCSIREPAGSVRWGAESYPLHT